MTVSQDQPYMGMMRFAIFSLATLVLVGCGASGSTPQNGGLSPSQAAPTTGKLKGPPPAWVETARGSRWLGYSSFCWGTSCADFIAPRCGERHTPTLRLQRGETVRFHLGFRPTELGVTFFGANSGGIDHLPLSRAPTWRVERAGAFSLFARVQGGDASYVACVRFT
jgi:hypothetical protein